MTKEEYKDLKQYSSPEYINTDIIVTNYLPEKLFIVVRYNPSDPTDYRHRIVEINSISEFIYYGCNGNLLKCGNDIFYSYTPIKELKVIGNKWKDKITFFTEDRNFSCSYRTLKDISVIFSSHFTELIRDLKRNKISPKGLNKFLYCIPYWITVDKISIEAAFHLKPTELRQLSENFQGDEYNSYTRVYQLKNVFGTSVKDICKYLPIYSDVNARVYLYELTKSKSGKKEYREIFRYCLNLYEQNRKLLNTYLDYRHVLYLMPKELGKGLPIYPQDFSKINSLHDKAVEIFNREQERIKIAKNAENQTRYLENYYKLAKSFEFSDDTYSIVAVKDLQDLIREGRILKHCVGSYIDSVSNGKEYILFLRQNKDIETPFFTIDVTPDNKVRQIHGHSNCNISKDIHPFIKKWANKFKLDISNCSGIYAALR